MRLYLVLPSEDYGGGEYQRLVCADSPRDACHLAAIDHLVDNVARFDQIPETPYPQGDYEVADDEWRVFEISLPLPNRSGVVPWADLTQTLWKPAAFL
jgi:hypothetical protein